MIINQTLKRFQQRVICNNKGYSFRFILFVQYCYFLYQIELCSFHLRLNVQDSFLLGTMISYCTNVLQNLFFIVYPANPQSLTKNNRTFGTVWMSRCIGQVLMFVSRRNVQVCGQLTSRQAHLKVQKGNVFFIELMSNLILGWQ